MHLIEDHAKRAGIPPRFASSQVIEKDEIILEKLHLDKNELEACEHIVEQMESESEMDREAAIANMRFNFIKKLCDSFVSKPHKSNKYLLSANADKFLLSFIFIPLTAKAHSAHNYRYYIIAQ